MSVYKRVFAGIVLLFCGLMAGWLLHEYFYRPEHASSPPLTGLAGMTYLPDLSEVATAPPFQELSPRLSDTRLFQDYLDEGRFDYALTLYQKHESHDSLLLSELRAALVKKVSQWQQEEDLESCINVLERFTQYYYQDTQLLKMQVNALEKNNELARAIEVCMQVSPLASRQAEASYYTESGQRLARRLFHQHQQSGSIATCLSLFQQLAYLQSDYSFYRYALALIYLSLGDTDETIRELAALQPDQEFGRKASQLLVALQPVLPEEPEARPAGMIPLQVAGRHLLVLVRVGEKGQARLLIDTGASLTTMPSPLLQELKRKKQAARVGHVELRTASGCRFSALYSLKSFQVGQYILKNLEVAELDMGEGEKADGLLGMNVLTQFRFQIDQERPALILSPR